MTIRYIVERYTDKWEQASELPFNVGAYTDALDLMKGAQLRYPLRTHRVMFVCLTEEEFACQEHTKKLERIADDILRQVVCHCGCYRHHGVNWMPEGSGEGLSVAVEILRKAGL